MVTTMEVVFALSLAVLSSCHCSAAFVAAPFGWRDWRSAQIYAAHARTFVKRTAGGPHRPRRRRISATCPDAWPPLRSNAIPQGKGIQRIRFAMNAGSILGATLGGLAVAYAPVQFLKLLLGCVLIVGGGKTMSGHCRGKRPRERPIARVENARRIMGRGRQREDATSRPWCRRGGVRCPPVGVGVRDLIAR